jgi:outer membrane biosynthesis protein TonB
MAAILMVLGALAGLFAARAVKRGAPPTPSMAIEEARKIREAVSTSGASAAAYTNVTPTPTMSAPVEPVEPDVQAAPAEPDVRAEPVEPQAQVEPPEPDAQAAPAEPVS